MVTGVYWFFFRTTRKIIIPMRIITSGIDTPRTRARLWSPEEEIAVADDDDPEDEGVLPVTVTVIALNPS